jgi:hypothetical protein
MCRYAQQDQPRPRQCVELRNPCDECAAEEQAKMNELGEEYAQQQRKEDARRLAKIVWSDTEWIRINDSLVTESH